MSTHWLSDLHELEGEEVLPCNRSGPGAFGVTMDAVPAGSDPGNPAVAKALWGIVKGRLAPKRLVRMPDDESGL